MPMTLDEARSSDLDGNHNPASAASIKSKAEQLARTRRNQQRCRERKRTHVAELELQVEALQAKVQQCEPCAPPSSLRLETALETSLRENAARKDLLSALGFDDETQQRFIESSAKRQAVHEILQENHNSTSPSQIPDGRLAETPLAPFAQFDAQSARIAAESADSGSGSGQPMDTLGTNTDSTNVAINGQTNTPDPDISDWLFSPETLNKLPPFSMEPSGDFSWLPEPYSSYGSSAQEAGNSSAPIDSTLTLGTMSKRSLDDLSNDVQWTPMTADNDQSAPVQSIERCFLDTVVQFQASETSTVCSLALSRIFQHNRKGLPMAELQKRLEPGMRTPSEASGECRIEDSVLFRVLADISA